MKSLLYSVIILFSLLYIQYGFTAETSTIAPDPCKNPRSDRCKVQLAREKLELENLKRQAERDKVTANSECKDKHDDYSKAITERDTTCGKIGLGSVACEAQVRACESKTNEERRSFSVTRESTRTASRVERRNKKYCALTPVKGLGANRKKIENYDGKLQTAKDEVEKYEQEIEEQINDINGKLQSDVDDGKDAITDFTRRAKEESESRIEEISAEVLALEAIVTEAQQEKVNLRGATDLKKAEFETEEAQIDAECGQKAATEFKSQEIEYQKRQASKIRSGQYRTSGFGLFFGQSSKRLQGGIDRQKRIAWRKYLKEECKLDEGVLLRKNQLAKAAVETENAYERGLVQIEQLIQENTQKAQTERAKLNGKLADNFEIQKEALSRLQRTQQKAEQALLEAQQKVPTLQQKLIQAQNKVTKYNRLINTIEQSIADTEARASETNVDSESKANDINLALASVDKVESALGSAFGICGCNDVNPTRNDPVDQSDPLSASERVAATEVSALPRDSRICSALERAVRNNQSGGNRDDSGRR